MTQVAQQVRPLFPAVGQIFELTASSEVTPLGLVADFGRTPSEWRTSAVSIPSGTTRRFKLLAVGYQPGLAAVARACKAQGGKETNGCLMKVFDETFGSNGRNPVGVPDASWVSPGDLADFPVVYWDGRRHFDWANDSRDRNWLWLVEVEDKLPHGVGDGPRHIDAPHPSRD